MAPSTADSDAQSALLVSYRAGDVIYREARPGTEMYIVEEGQVEIVKRLGPEERRLALLEAGDFFGEMSVLENSPRHATARALTDCRLLPIDASTFDRMLREYPEITVRMMRTLSRRLHEHEEASLRAAQIAAGHLGGVPRAGAEELEPVIAAPRGQTPPASPGKATSPRLLHPETGTAFPLMAGPETVIGRFDPVTGMSPDIDLREVDTRRTMSRRHARISCRDGKYFIQEEVGTANGTFVRGTRLATGKEHEIEHGDRLRLGLVELVFEAG
jgi:CRP-like cAMP-binding protein